MLPEKAIKKLVDEMMQQGIITKGNRFRAERYLYMAHGVGYNSGKQVKNYQRPVERIDKFGNVIGESFESATVAARLTGVCASDITKVCQGYRNTAGKTGWRYVK